MGAGMQVVAILLPVLDLFVLGTVQRHVQAAYPSWGPRPVDQDTRAIIFYLVGGGVLGLGGWLLALVLRRKRWARGLISTLFVIGMLVLVTTATLGGGAYQQIVPPWLGTTQLVILGLPGLAALVAVWRRPTDG